MSSRRLAGSRRPAKRKRRTGGAQSSQQENKFTFPLIQDIKPPRKVAGLPYVKPAVRKRAVFALPFNHLYGQQANLPMHKSLVGLDQLLGQSSVSHPSSPGLEAESGAACHIQGVNSPSGEDADGNTWWNNLEEPWLASPVKKTPRTEPSDRHRRRRETQYSRWTREVIPALVRPMMHYLRRSENGRKRVDVEDGIWGSKSCKCLRPPRRITVLLAQWNTITTQALAYCQCTPAAHTLVSHGYFPCAPIQPSLAFDINLLELVSLVMANTVPNVSGWSLSLEQFWAGRGYILGIRERLRKRFSNACQWYAVLMDTIHTDALKQVHPAISTHPRNIEPPSNVSGSSRESTNDPKVQNTRPSHNPSTVHPYLRRACPACFGYIQPQLLTSPAHVLVCLDANFTQKRQKSNYDDPRLDHPLSHFIPAEEVQAVEKMVEKMRSGIHHDLDGRLPEEVLDECEQSFVAAAEQAAKASKLLYADTGLMALLCRHDRVLWVVNMTTPGEKQFYAFALISRLFEYLPPEWHVGLLYDIACQLERSMHKHNILAPYHGRMIFAVSVFHAYGHQWPCQLLYHPRKREDFGLTDGEGCERFWSSLKRFIPSLRVTGHHRRIWLLDRQIHHSKQDTIRLMGLWIKRKREACAKVIQQASRTLQQLKLPGTYLKQEWGAQVASQTSKLDKHTRSAADKAIDRILDLRSQRDEIHMQIRKIRVLIRVAEPDSESHAALKEDLEALQSTLETSHQSLRSAEKSLGVAGRKRLEGLKGNEYLRLRMHAKALKIRIRAKVVAQKFERGRLERVYRHHVNQEKDHAQTKTLLKRGQQTISVLVTRFNRMVAQMDDLRQRGKAPGRTRLPKRLDIKQLFRLDVDDEMWNDDGLLDTDVTEPPAWLSDPNTREGIIALLQRQRGIEERERLKVEEEAMMRWLRYEIMDTQRARIENDGDPALAFVLELRLRELWGISEHWRRHLDVKKEQEFMWMTARDFPEGLAPPTLYESNLVESPKISARNVTPEEVESGSDDSFSDQGDEVEELAALCEEMRRAVPVPSLSSEATDSEVSEQEEMIAEMICDVVSPDMEASAVTDRELGRSCGRWNCYADDIAEVKKSHGWFDGSVITVLAEAILQRLGTAAQAVHMTPLVLHAVRQTLDHAADHENNPKQLAWVRKEYETTRSFAAKDIWLIPAHVPLHWTLVALKWSVRHVYFMDSLPRRLGAQEDEDRVKEEVRELLRIIDEDRHYEWTWVSEQRPTRQKNGYDCGAFVLADMAAFMEQGVPSMKTQLDMPAWRKALVTMLDELPGLRYEKMDKSFLAEDVEVIVIDD